MFAAAGVANTQAVPQRARLLRRERLRPSQVLVSKYVQPRAEEGALSADDVAQKIERLDMLDWRKTLSLGETRERGLASLLSPHGGSEATSATGGERSMFSDTSSLFRSFLLTSPGKDTKPTPTPDMR